MTEPMKVTFDLSLQDERRALLLNYGVRRLVVLGLAYSIAATILYIKMDAAMEWSPILSGLFIGGGGTFFFLLPVAIFVMPTVRRWMKPRSKFSSLAFDENSVHVQTEFARSDVKWALFRKAKFDRHTCLLVFGPAQFVTVPLRAFATETERLRFLELVKSKIPRVLQF
jgi:hypothetical protein